MVFISNSPYRDHAKWDCPKKKQYRDLVIVQMIQHFFGTSLIPSGKQYWTMCGAHYNKDTGKLDGEYGHMHKSGLILPEQFYGVDREIEIIEQNKLYYPEVPNWIHGDFLKVMENYQGQDLWNPIVVNYDGVMKIEKGAIYFSRILEMFESHNDEALVFANFLMNNPYHGNDPSQLADDNQAIQEIVDRFTFPDYWQIVNRSYYYRGSGTGSKSIMNCFIFHKKPHTGKPTYNSGPEFLDIEVKEIEDGDIDGWAEGGEDAQGTNRTDVAAAEGLGDNQA